MTKKIAKRPKIKLGFQATANLKTSTNSREQALMSDSVSSELEAAAKLNQQERLYELQVQEYRRRKKVEAIKRKKMMEAAASEQQAGFVF